jgi:Lrp/AsnC family leucine-responsive transcriptional regulator
MVLDFEGPDMLDAIDRRILEILLDRGRTPWVQLAAEIDLTAPSAAERVRRLEQAGYILGYGARVDPRALGQSLLAFVAVSVFDSVDHEKVVEWADSRPEIQEFHTVAGEHDYLMKVRVPDPEHLEQFLRHQVRALHGVHRTTTTVVLHTTKETASVPLPEGTG